MSEQIRVVIVDDISETREHLTKLLSFESDIQVVGTASSGEEAVELAGKLAPDILLMRGEVAALIGPNGAGKSTFLKTILGQIAPLSGEAKIGASVEIGYFAQAHELLDPNRSILDEVLQEGSSTQRQEAERLIASLP